MVKDFSEPEFRKLCEAIKYKTVLMKDYKDTDLLNSCVFLRHDVDNDIDRAYRMAKIESNYEIFATFFILNTAPYWVSDPSLFDKLRSMQAMGHEIAWHNNAHVQFREHNFREGAFPLPMRHFVQLPLETLRTNGIRIHGSASHGDRKCYEYGVINYEIFHECPRTDEAKGFPQPKVVFPKLSMKDFGLEYEAYHIHYDLYLSESGGRKWNREFTEQDLFNSDSTQILIHPQWWNV